MLTSKVVLSLLSFCFFQSTALAQKTGYAIDLQIKSLANQKVYLAHYYGRGNTVYKTDSVSLNDKGAGKIAGKNSIVGGLYLILDTANGNFVEFVLNDGDQLKFRSKASDFRTDALVTGSQDNEDFNSYQQYLKNFDKEKITIEQKFNTAKNSEDSAAVQKEIYDHIKKLNKYRSTFYESHPESFVATMFGAIYEPEIPSETHYLEDGTVDSNYNYRYYKKHYWDRFPFHDERIAYSPVYHPKLERYMEKMVLPSPDSVSKEALWLLDTTDAAPELFKYTLWFENSFIWSTKIMGLQEAIIPIAEKYYQDPTNTFWLDSAGYEKMMKKIVVMRPSMLDNIGNNLKLENRQGETVMLHDISGDYLAVIFWEPDCGHCRKEVPKIDSIYKSAPDTYKEIQLVAIKGGGDSSVYDRFIAEKGLEEGWIHLNDDKRQSNFRYYYDVESYPTLIVLNPERRIIAKKFNFEDILNIIEIDKKKRKRKNEE